MFIFIQPNDSRAGLLYQLSFIVIQTKLPQGPASSYQKYMSVIGSQAPRPCIKTPLIHFLYPSPTVYRVSKMLNLASIFDLVAFEVRCFETEQHIVNLKHASRR